MRKTLWYRAVAGLLLVSVWFGTRTVGASGSSAPDAKQLIEAAATAMGGLEKLAAIRAVKFSADGHQNLLEQSERPEGPWIVSYDAVTELRDFENNRFRQEKEDKSAAIGAAGKSVVVVAGGIAAMERAGRQFPGGTAQVFETEASLALSPERLPATALAAGDLHGEADVVLQGVPHHVVGFTWRGAPVRVFLNAHTSLPTAVEIVRANPYDFFWGVWGDFSSRTSFSFWSLEPGGIHYPRQWDFERNGTPFRTLTISQIEFNPKAADTDFQITEDVKTGFARRAGQKISDLPLGRPDRPASELAPGIVQIPGLWNVALIRQEDGIVILEAPISSGYSAKVIAEAEKRFPGVKIKAAISTSDAWPHLGGAREYAARGIPLYILDVNQPIIGRLLAAPFRTEPDALSRAKGKPELRVVSGKTVVGTGPNRLELFPIRSETGERMMMVYAPEHRLLYGSDLVQPMGGGKFFMPQYLSELADATRREGLDVSRVFAMHAPVLDWKLVVGAIAEANAPKASDEKK